MRQTLHLSCSSAAALRADRATACSAPLDSMPRPASQALNDLFEKILQRDVPARYLLRLGMGEQDLATTSDFSRVGRVNAMLARRLELLAEARSA